MRRILSRFKKQSSGRHSRSPAPDPSQDPDLSTTQRAGPTGAVDAPECPFAAPPLENIRPKLVDSGPQVNAPLESLPAEVRRHLCSELDLEGLSALVHASPVFHQQYLLDRRTLLCACLETTLQSTTVDACAVYRSSLASFSQTRTLEEITHFLHIYQDQRSSATYSIQAERLTEDEIVCMVAFYFSILKPLTRHYTEWALANLAQESENLQIHEPLSKTEEARLLRALYRFQLCCNLYGGGPHRTGYQARLEHGPIDLIQSFIGIFEPWEVEEIACIYDLSKEKYDKVFLDIRWDVHEENPKFEGQRPPTPDGAFDLDNSYPRETLLTGTISCGLELLHEILFMIRDHEHLVSTMQEHISYPDGNFLEYGALGEGAQLERRRARPSSRDEKEERRDLLPFEGDRELGPPLAWTLIWQGTYSNLYGYYVGDALHRWGYIMWDAKRLEQTGGTEVLMRQWKREWIYTDPRERM